MLERLAGIEERYNELERMMADPIIAQDYEKVAEYAQERAELQEIVDTYRSYKVAEEELSGARIIIDDEDDPFDDF